MYTRMVHPDSLSSAEVDAFLAQGWFRMRQSMFTCRFVMSDGYLRSTVWLRFPLHTGMWKKSLRRVLHRNDALFDVSLRPLVIDAEKEDLYAVYRDNFPGDLSPDVESVLYDDKGKDIFRTLCFEVRQDGRLVAFSFFDTGIESVASIIGVYDPDLSKYGLGFYTMLLEARFGQETGRTWFYPGYIAPGCQAFDYKLRMGAPEAWNAELARWEAYTPVDAPMLPANRIEHALLQFVEAASDAGIAAQPYLYPPHGVVEMGQRTVQHLCEPMFVRVLDGMSGDGRLLVTWRADTEMYEVALYVRVRDLRESGGVDHPRGPFVQSHELFRRVHAVGTSASLLDVVRMVHRRPASSRKSGGDRGAVG